MKRILFGFFIFTVFIWNGCKKDENPSNNAHLASLSVSAGALSPSFQQDTISYKVNVENSVSKITITGIPVEKDAVLSENSGVPQELFVGANKITILVTAPDKLTTKLYTVIVNRAGSTNADLSSISLSTGSLSPVFDPAVTNYSVAVENDISEITITGTTSDGSATLSTKNGVNQSLNVGNNAILLTITAQNGTTTKTYTVNVYREYNRNLSSITLSTGTLSPVFDKNVSLYLVNVPNSVSTFKVTGTPEDANASVGGDNGVSKTLNVGMNNLKIEVTANGKAKTYNIKVIRLGTEYTSANIGKLVYVPEGTFQRDGTATNLSAVSAFRMSQYEITRAQFNAILGADPSDESVSTGTNDPVQKVTFYQVVAFCNKLSIKEGLTPVYTVDGVDFNTLTFAQIPTVTYTFEWMKVGVNKSANGYRLPTEMEWMWAAMGAYSDKVISHIDINNMVNTLGYKKGYSGSDETGSQVVNATDYAWISNNSDSKTHPVGQKKPNELGLYDLTGNVWEMLNDCRADYPSGLLTDYYGPEYDSSNFYYRVSNGGSFTSSKGTTYLYINYRGAYSSYMELTNGDGFRVVRK